MVLQLKYKQVKILSDEQFRRLAGVNRRTFDKIIKYQKMWIKRKSERVVQKKKAGHGGLVINGIGVYERIPGIFSYQSKLWNKLKFML